MCVILVLCNFLVVIVSSLSFFDKYSIKKDYCKGLLKTIINKSKQQEQVKQNQIDEYIGKLQKLYLARFICLMIFNIFCVILCILIQKNILKSNSV